MMARGDGHPMLEGIKVIDLTTIVFGPYCTQILADLGAEVIKIEAPGGDGFRYSATPAKTPGMAPSFIALNRGKKSLMLDLKNEDDAAILRDLLRNADVFIHNVREAAIGRLGFGYDDVRALNPKIIYTHCVGFGSSGPYAGLQAYDDVIQAATGTTNLLSRVDGDPRPRYLPSLIADKVAGLHGAQAVLAAIIHRLRTGKGQHVEVPMLEAFASFMLKEHLDAKTFDPPNGDAAYARQVNPDRQPFQTADGWISIVPYTIAQFPIVVALLGDPDFAKQERFGEVRAIIAASAEFYAKISELARTKTTAECLEILRANEVPAMPVTDLDDVIDDPHLRETGFFVRSDHPSEGSLFQMRDPIRYDGYDRPDPGHAPRLGEHGSEFGKG